VRLLLEEFDADAGWQTITKHGSFKEWR
jgi:hypothetical protein